MDKSTNEDNGLIDNDPGPVGDVEHNSNGKGVHEEGYVSDNNEEQAQPKKKKKKRRALLLDEDDYELLEENLGIRHVRPERRRIKKAREKVAVEGGDAHQTNVEQLRAELFGPDEEVAGLEDELEEEHPAEQGQPLEETGRENSFQGQTDDEDNWIVDEFEENGGRGVNRARRQDRGLQLGVDEGAVEEARDIFGDAEELLAIYRAQQERLPGQEEGMDDEEELFPEDETKEADRVYKQNVAPNKRLVLDPEALETHFLQATDEVIRDTDVPEYEQLTRRKDPAVFDLQACSEWIWSRIFDEQSPYKHVREILEVGAREVEGPPPKWFGTSTWPSSQMFGGLTDTGGCRGFYLGREGAEKEAWRANVEAQEALKLAISNYLDLMYNKHEEVSFVAMYRKELLGELLSVADGDQPFTLKTQKPSALPAGALQATNRHIRRWDVLYAVHDLSLQWRSIQRTKEAKLDSFKEGLKNASEREAQLLSRRIEHVSQATSKEELADAEVLFQLETTTTEELSEEMRRPQRMTRYSVLCQSGLLELFYDFMLKGDGLSENIERGYQKQAPTDPPESPEATLATYVDAHHPLRATVSTALQTLIDLTAHQIAAEPAVRKLARSYIRRHAVVSTTPTKSGEATLHAFHALGPVKRLEDKPLLDFAGKDLFLRVILAEQSGFITSDIQVAQEGLVNTLADLYLPASGNESWNEVRLASLRQAVSKHIIPVFIQEARHAFKADAVSVLSVQTIAELWKFASKAPLQIQTVDEDAFVAERRFMAVCYGPGSPATTVAMLDPAGNLVDYLHCVKLSGFIASSRDSGRVASNIFSDPSRSEEADTLRKFIQDHMPHAIIIGASHPQALVLAKVMRAITDRILEDNPRAFTAMESGGISHWLADERLPSVWENSAAANKELPNALPIVRRAVGLGRQMLDPLALLAAASGQEVLGLSLHPLQQSLSAEDLGGILNQVLKTAVAQVGVSINAATSYPWLSQTVPFIPGLGIRKGDALRRAITSMGGMVDSRKQLWAELGVLGNCVFRNAAGCCRIFSEGSMLETHPLDNTRIHPESYEHAVQIAQSAVYGEGDVALENALAQPEEVMLLDVGAYDQHLRDQDQAGAAGTLLATLIDIQMEFSGPYGELRPPLQHLTDIDVFSGITGQASELLKRGRRVEAHVRRVADKRVFCMLPELNGVEAVLDQDDIRTRDNRLVECMDYCKSGDILEACIKDIDSASGIVMLSAIPEQMSDTYWEEEYLRKQDPYYKVVAPAKRIVKNRQRALQRPAGKGRGLIKHPLYRNISMSQAVDELQASGDVGTAIIRPGKSNSRQLVVTMCTAGKGFWHININETGQRTKEGIAPPLEVELMPGQPKERYEDLDEIEARLIGPIAANMRNLQNHRKWFDEPWQNAEKRLRDMRQRQPNVHHYCLCSDSSGHGRFYLGYFTTSTPRNEGFSVLPKGFYFRKTMYPNIDAMINAFKMSMHK